MGIDNRVGIGCGSGEWDGPRRAKKEKLGQLSQNNNKNDFKKILALGLPLVLVCNLGCVLGLLEYFKQCAQATPCTNYLKTSRGGSQA